jgi:hypothetical protein
MKTQVTKKQASIEIAKLIKSSFVDGGQYYIGLNDNGDIDYWYSTSPMDNMVVSFADLTGGEWSFGDFEGDVENADDWDEETLNGIAESFEKSWIDDAIRENDNIEVNIEWKAEVKVYQKYLVSMRETMIKNLTSVLADIKRINIDDTAMTADANDILDQIKNVAEIARQNKQWINDRASEQKREDEIASAGFTG